MRTSRLTCSLVASLLSVAVSCAGPTAPSPTSDKPAASLEDDYTCDVDVVVLSGNLTMNREPRWRWLVTSIVPS